MAKIKKEYPVLRPKRYKILIRIWVRCGECGVGGHYETRTLNNSSGMIYEFSEREAEKYIETYSKSVDSITMVEI